MPTRYFLNDTPLGGTERAMQIPAGFRLRGGGIRVFRYNAEDCDCRYCLHIAEKEKRCKAASCVCFPERLGAGSIPYAELVSEMIAEVSFSAFTMRVQKLLQEKEVMELLFRNARHKNRWNSLVKRGMLTGRVSPAFAAALFLLTSDEFLWNKARYHVGNGKIDFAEINIRGIDTDGYAIFKTAKELYGGERHIRLSELTDPDLIGDKLLRLIVNSFVVRRYVYRGTAENAAKFTTAQDEVIAILYPPEDEQPAEDETESAGSEDDVPALPAEPDKDGE